MKTFGKNRRKIKSKTKRKMVGGTNKKYKIGYMDAYIQEVLRSRNTEDT